MSLKFEIVMLKDAKGQAVREVIETHKTIEAGQEVLAAYKADAQGQEEFALIAGEVADVTPEDSAALEELAEWATEAAEEILANAQQWLDQHFEGQFMRPVVEWMDAYQVETSEGTEVVPADVLPFAHRKKSHVKAKRLADYVSGRILDGDVLCTRESGYFARLSASGYMDCTDWSGPWSTFKAAADYLIETYAD